MISLERLLYRLRGRQIGRRRTAASKISLTSLCQQLEIRSLLSATIQGQIWEDDDQDGRLDEGEDRAHGIRVDLLSVTGEILQTTITTDVDLNGNGVIDDDSESGVYRFDVDSSTAYTVSPSEIGFYGLTNPRSQRTVSSRVGSIGALVVNEASGTAYAANRDQGVFEYHIATNSILRTFEFDEVISNFALSPDGRNLAVAERDSRDNLVTIHVVDLKTEDVQTWQHDPSGTATGIWDVAWSSDNRLFLLLGALSRPDDQQILTFDLDTKQFEPNRMATFGADLVSTANGERTILTGLGENNDQVAIYSAADGTWSEIPTDVAQVRSGDVTASNRQGDRFLITRLSSGPDHVVDENFQTLFEVPSQFLPYGFRSTEDTLLGYLTSTKEALRFDATTGVQLPVDFHSEGSGLHSSVDLHGHEYFVSSNGRDFQRINASKNLTAVQQILVRTTDAATVSVPDIGVASPNFLFTPNATTLSLTEDGAAQQIQVLLNRRPSSDVVIEVSVADSTEVSVSQTAITFTPQNWQSPQLLQLQGVPDDVIDFRVDSNVTLSINASSSAAEFSSVESQTIVISTFDSDTAIRGRVSSNAHIPGTNFSDYEYINGVTIDLFDKLGALIASTQTTSYDINQNGSIETANEKGWYRFDLFPEGYYTVIQRGVGPAGQPTTTLSTANDSARWIEGSRNQLSVLDPVRPYAYATTESGQVVRQDTRAFQEGLLLDVGETPQGIAVSADGQFLYVGEGAGTIDGFRIHQLNLNTLQQDSFVVPMPAGQYNVKELKVTALGELVASVVNVAGQNTIMAVDRAASAPTGQTLYQGNSFRSIVEITADGKRMLLSMAVDNSAAILVDVQNQQVIATAAASLTPTAMNAAGDRIFAQSLHNDALLLNGTFQQLHHFGQFAAGAVFIPNHKQMYLGNGRTDRLQRIDLETFNVLEASTVSFPKSGPPMTFALSPSEDDLLVQDRYSYYYRIDHFGSDAGVHAINLSAGQIESQLDFTRTAPQISVSFPNEGIRLDEDNDEVQSLQFRLSHAPSENVYVTVRGTDPTELLVAQQTFAFTPTTWKTDQTITFQAVDDDFSDGHRQSALEFQIDFDASDSLYAAAATKTINVTTLDNENLLQGRIWQDSNENGVFNFAELGRNGRTVQLVDRDLNVIQTAVTASIDLNNDGQISPASETGWYSFQNVPEAGLFIRQIEANEQGQTFPAAEANSRLEIFDVRQHAYSSITDILYAPDFKTGELHRYHVGLQQSLNPISLGGRPNSIDVSADGRTLWIGDATAQGAEGLIRSLDLQTGELTSFRFQQDALGFGVNELVAMENGLILFTSLTSRSEGQLRQLDSESGTVSNRHPIEGAVFLSRSFDHRTAVMVESAGDKTVHRYDSSDDRLIEIGQLPMQGTGLSVTLNNDGRFLAFETSNRPATIFNRSLQQLVELPSSNGDFVFHPTEPIIYLLNSNGRNIQALSMVTGQEVGSYPLHTTTGLVSRFSLNISDDGRYVFLTSLSGLQIVRVSSLPSDAGAALPITVQQGDLIDNLNFGIATPKFAYFSEQPSLSVEEGKTESLGRLRLTERPSFDVQITLSNSEPSQLSLLDELFVFTTSNWNQWQQVTGTAVVDDVFDGDATVNLVASIDAAQSDPTFHDAEAVSFSVSVVDGDSPGIQVNSSSIVVTEGRSSSELTVSLLQPPTNDVRLLISRDSESSLTVQTTALLFTPDNWNIAQSITLSVSQNGAIEERLFSTVTISVDAASSAAEYGSVANSSVFIQIDNSNIVDIADWYQLSNNDTQIAWNFTDDDFGSRPLEIQIVRLLSSPEVVFSQTFESANNRLRITDLFDNGRYRIWLRATKADGTWSPWSNRSVERNVVPQLADAGYSDTSDDLQLQWTQVAGASSYRIFVSNISSGESAIVDTTVTGNSVILPDIKQLGRLRVWVQAVTDEGLRSGWSAYKEVSLLVEGISPKFHTSEAQPTFEWTSVPGAASYEFYVSEPGSVTRHFKNITTTRFTPDQPLESGLHRWWVRGVTTTGRPTKWSEGYDVTIGNTTLLTEETRTATLNTPLFQWYEVVSAASYDLYIVEEFGDRKVTRYDGLTMTEFQSAPLKQGRHRIWVRTVLENGEGDWGQASFYTVTDLEQNSTVENLSTAPATIDQDLHFEWTTSESVASFDLIIVGKDRNYL